MKKIISTAFFKLYEMSCESMLVFVVTFQKSSSTYNSAREEIVLNDVVLNPSRGDHIGINFKDIDNDGILEIDYVRGCGTVNCRHKIYKLKENYSKLDDAEDYIYLLIEEDAWYDLDIEEDYLVAHSRDSIASYYSRIPISYEVHNVTHVDSVKYCLIKKYIQSDSKVNSGDSFVFLTKEEAEEQIMSFCRADSIFTVTEPSCKNKLTPC